MKPVLYCLLLLFCTTPAYAAESGITFLPPAQIAQNKATIDRLQKYLSNLKTVVAEFTQVAPDGTLSNGKFFMERPGKMRWQYNPPTPILMVSNGSELVFYDYELEQVNHIPLDSTLIGFLAQDKISFDDMVGIINLSKNAGVIRITLAQKEKPDEGQLMLEFSDNPLLLRNMEITDATNQVTTVALNNARFGVKLDSRLFEFRDPRKGRR
jgi:outer membrane lipoprotein-sorting protein